MSNNPNNQLTLEQMLKLDETANNTKPELCTCKDRPIYIGGQYFTIKSTTTYKKCKACNHRRNS